MASEHLHSPRADGVDRYVGARMRERRVMLGLTQQQLAELIGVTYQQEHKYETGLNRIASGRLHRIAQALGVEHGYFFEGLNSGAQPLGSSKSRMLLELAKNFGRIRDRNIQARLCTLARVLAEAEGE